MKGQKFDTEFVFSCLRFWLIIAIAVTANSRGSLTGSSACRCVENPGFEPNS